MRVKTRSEELEFGGSKTPIYRGFGVPEAPSSYYTTHPLDKGELPKRTPLPILESIIVQNYVQKRELETQEKVSKTPQI
jgi:hypothetical protein